MDRSKTVFYRIRQLVLRPILPVALIALCVVGSSCGPTEATKGDRQFLGLRAACVPSWRPNTLVAPGEVVLDIDERLDDVRFEFNSEVEGADFGLASSGVMAGDAADVTSEMQLEMVEPISLTGPGRWPIVVIVDPEVGDEGLIRLSRVYYKQGGDQFYIDQLFELTVATDCG